MKKNNKLSVSIATTAFNEENNIKKFLGSVCSQTEETISIKEIIVISDASTDTTVDIVKNYKDKRMKAIVGRKRQGKANRLNYLLKIFNGDVLVVFDADVILKDNRVVERLAKRFREDEKVGMVSGNIQPLPAQTFIEAAVNNFLIARELLKKTYNFDNSAHAAHGPIMAFSRRFAQRLNIPNIMGVDGYSYLACKSQGFKFYHVADAIVWFRSPQTVKDYVAQATRFLAGGLKLNEYFDKDLVNKEYNVPLSAQVKIMLIQLVRNPLGYIFLKVLFRYAVWQSHSYLKKTDGRWSQIGSSKQLFKPSQSNR